MGDIDRTTPRPPGNAELKGAWRAVLYDYHVNVEHKLADEFDGRQRLVVVPIKNIFQTGDYVKIYGFVEFVLRNARRPNMFYEAITIALEDTRSPYRVLDGDTLVPIASSEEADAAAMAIRALAASGVDSGRQHLRSAAEALSSGDWADSIRESIHAVEAVARLLEPSATTLPPALNALERSGAIHPAMKRGFTILYGYTSDEDGIRHSLLDNAVAQVGETEALFMFSSCAAFISYLLNKGCERRLPAR
jgi:hypothetical protein